MSDIFQGNKIQITEMTLKNENNELQLSWKIYSDGKFSEITFYNVSRLKLGEVSAPLEIDGLEIIDRSQNGWEKDSAYEIRDFEDDRVSFFCERFEADE